MISLLHSTEVCALFPTRLDRLRLVSRTTWCLRRRMTEPQSFRSATPYDRVDRYTYFPLHLLVYHCKSSHNLINYARAHSSLWLHTEVSSMNNLMIPLSLGGGPKKNRQSWNTQVPQSTQMCIKVATLNKPLINNLTSIMDTIKPNPRLQAQHNDISKHRSNSQGFDNKQGNRFYLIIYFPIPTS